MRNRKGIIESALIGAILVAGIITAQFVKTVADGTFKGQVDKIKAAHHRPITVDK